MTPTPAQRPALTTPGVIILQSLVLFLAIAIDLAFSKSIGLLTGFALVFVFAAGAILSRSSARTWSAITPPLAVVISLFVLMPTIGTSSFKPTRLAVDLLNSLAQVAPFLVLGAAATWAYVIVASRSTSPRRADRA